jgi:glucuronokinase
MVAGHATRLERELRNDTSGEFDHLVNIPKALLPGPDGPLLLDQWWYALTNARSRFSDIFMVTVRKTEREG